MPERTCVCPCTLGSFSCGLPSLEAVGDHQRMSAITTLVAYAASRLRSRTSVVATTAPPSRSATATVSRWPGGPCAMVERLRCRARALARLPTALRVSGLPIVHELCGPIQSFRRNWPMRAFKFHQPFVHGRQVA